jgi:hypothetical protein
MSLLLKPEITNELGQKQWNYVVTQVGLEAAFAALEQLSTTNKKLFPFNVARLLKVELPQQLLTNPKKNRSTREISIQESLNDRSWAYED